MLEVTVHQSGQTAAVERVLGIVRQSTAACYLKLYPSAIHSFIKPPRRLDPCTYIKAFQGFNLCCVCFGMFAHTQTTHIHTLPLQAAKRSTHWGNHETWYNSLLYLQQIIRKNEDMEIQFEPTAYLMKWKTVFDSMASNSNVIYNITESAFFLPRIIESWKCMIFF